MSKTFHPLRVLLWTANILLGGFLLLVVLAGLASSGPGYLEAIFHLVAGFWFFLREKLPAISSDAGTWGPGLAAWMVALAVAHRFLRNWAASRGYLWRVTTTACLGLLLPVLFAISFIVPGILLQVDGLREVRWFKRTSMKESSVVHLDLRNLAQGCALSASRATDGRFPDSLDGLTEQGFMSAKRLYFPDDPHVPPEPPIYLGAGYTRDTPRDTPLAISRRFQERGTWMRVVVTVGGTMTMIHDDEVDTWLDRVIPR
jgi:hypothetical protein